MISHKYECIFIEVPKTGSTSIRSVIGHPIKPHKDAQEIKEFLKTRWPFAYYNPIFDFFYRRFNSKNKRTRIGEEKFFSYFKFGFVRNPWDRVVSLYERNEGVQLKDKMTFEEFVDWIQFSSDTCIHPSPHKNQLDWFLDDNDNILVDYIGKFENIEGDWKKIAEKIAAPKSLPHKNNKTQGKRDYRTYYDNRTKKVVREKFATDIEYFGYKFD